MFHNANFATGLTEKLPAGSMLRDKSCSQAFLIIYKHKFSICK